MAAQFWHTSMVPGSLPSSIPQQLPVPTCIPCANSSAWSAQLQRHQSQGSSSHSMSSPSPAPAQAACCVQGWNTCCSSAVEWIPKKIFLYPAPIARKPPLQLKTSKFTPKVRTAACWQSLGLISLEKYNEIQEIKSKNHTRFLERSSTTIVKL